MDKDMSTILGYLNRPPSPGADDPSHRAWPTYEAYRRNQRPEQLSEDRWRMCYGRAYNLGVRIYSLTEPQLDMIEVFDDELKAWAVFEEWFKDRAPDRERDFIINAGLTYVFQEEQANVAQQA
ncbi:MAG: hypothetical protein Q9228_006706 [Teloschistes exilis]